MNEQTARRDPERGRERAIQPTNGRGDSADGSSSPQTCAKIKLDGHIGASIQLVPNANGTARVEVYNMRGVLLAHQQVDGNIDRETASAIGFSLFNGFVFGYRACQSAVRSGIESVLSGPDSPLA